MLEPDVTLTDFLLTVVAGYSAFRIVAISSIHAAERRLWIGSFGAVAASSFAGGLAHGFFPRDVYDVAYRALWMLIFLAIGAAAYCLSSIAARHLRAPAASRAVAILLIPYTAYALGGGRNFLVCAGITVVGQALFLTAAIKGTRRSLAPWGWALAGCGVTSLALASQVFRFTPAPAYLTHNAFFHLLQAAGICLLFVFARRYL